MPETRDKRMNIMLMPTTIPEAVKTVLSLRLFRFLTARLQANIYKLPLNTTFYDKIFIKKKGGV